MAPQLLKWTVHDDYTIYLALALPTKQLSLMQFPVIGDGAHITISYRLRIHLVGDASWQAFWKLKHELMLMLLPRQVGFLCSSVGGHSFNLDPCSELHSALQMMRGTFEHNPFIEEIAAKPDPFHIAWAAL